MNEPRLLLPNYADQISDDDVENLSLHFSGHRYLLSPYNGSLYDSPRKRARKQWSDHVDPRNKGFESSYSNMLSIYNIYGSGYADAAKRYKDEWFSSLQWQKNFESPSDESELIEFKYSRATFMLFTTFLCLLIVSVVVSVRGYLMLSTITIEVAVFSFMASMCAGLGWLKCAEIDQRRVWPL